MTYASSSISEELTYRRDRCDGAPDMSVKTKFDRYAETIAWASSAGTGHDPAHSDPRGVNSAVAIKGATPPTHHPLKKLGVEKIGALENFGDAT